tara:strand:+ start:144 stop:629 length:486 start_codon:yes stop_codon:yes gene_type:complete
VQLRVAPETKDEDPSVKAASRGIYAHKETDGTVLSEDEKKEEKKDMRGYYAKINMVRNKIRAMGAKNPCVIADPDDVEKSWDKDKKEDAVKEESSATGSTKHDAGGTNSQYNADGTKKVKEGKAVVAGKNPDGSRYNPFTKDGKTKPGDKTPTSASQTTGS